METSKIVGQTLERFREDMAVAAPLELRARVVELMELTSRVLSDRRVQEGDS